MARSMMWAIFRQAGRYSVPTLLCGAALQLNTEKKPGIQFVAAYNKNYDGLEDMYNEFVGAQKKYYKKVYLVRGVDGMNSTDTKGSISAKGEHQLAALDKYIKKFVVGTEKYRILHSEDSRSTKTAAAIREALGEYCCEIESKSELNDGIPIIPDPPVPEIQCQYQLGNLNQRMLMETRERFDNIWLRIFGRTPIQVNEHGHRVNINDDKPEPGIIVICDKTFIGYSITKVLQEEPGRWANFEPKCGSVSEFAVNGKGQIQTVSLMDAAFIEPKYLSN